VDKQINLVGCGRTDTGVHASNFYAHFDLDQQLDQAQLDQHMFRLNNFLPKDISLKSIFPVESDLHARFSAKSRTYEYNIHIKKDPFLNEFSFYLYGSPDIELLNKACSILLEYDDFTSFARLHSQTKTNICSIKEAFWIVDGYKIKFTVTADRFLRNMVRAVVGTMLDVGLNKITLDEFREIIENKDRSLAGKSADARGLFLSRVDYGL